MEDNDPRWEVSSLDGLIGNLASRRTNFGECGRFTMEEGVLRVSGGIGSLAGIAMLDGL